MWMAEEQPIAAFRAHCAALLQKCTKRRNPRAWPNHDDRDGGICRQTEGVSLLHIDLKRASKRQTFSEIGGRDAQALAVADVVSHCVDGECDTTWVSLGRRRNRIDARLQRIQRFNERLRIRPD